MYHVSHGSVIGTFAPLQIASHLRGKIGGTRVSDDLFARRPLACTGPLPSKARFDRLWRASSSRSRLAPFVTTNHPSMNSPGMSGHGLPGVLCAKCLRPYSQDAIAVDLFG